MSKSQWECRARLALYRQIDAFSGFVDWLLCPAVGWHFYGIHRVLYRLALAALLFWFAGSAAYAQAQTKPAKFNFQSIQVAQVIQLIYGEVLTTPYVIQPEVLGDVRVVSFRYSNDKGDIKAFLGHFLHGLGYSITNKGGVDVIERRSEQQNLEAESFIYRPKFRDVNYLARLLSPLFQGAFSVNNSIAVSSPSKGAAPPREGSAAAMLDQQADVMLFTSSTAEIERLPRVLPQVDFAVGEVSVRGGVYEVSTTEKEGSGFGLLANLLKGKLSLGVGVPSATNSFIRWAPYQNKT